MGKYIKKKKCDRLKTGRKAKDPVVPPGWCGENITDFGDEADETL